LPELLAQLIGSVLHRNSDRPKGTVIEIRNAIALKRPMAGGRRAVQQRKHRDQDSAGAVDDKARHSDSTFFM